VVDITADAFDARDSASADGAAVADPGRDLVTVERFTEVWEAHILRARLEAEGLLASIADEHLVSMDWFYSNAIGGVRVQVPACELARAQEVLAALRRGDYQLDEEIDDDSSDP
jgi:hypothetical protein